MEEEQRLKLEEGASNLFEDNSVDLGPTNIGPMELEVWAQKLFGPSYCVTKPFYLLGRAQY